MDDEIKNFIKVWILAITSLIYSYYVAAHIPKGLLRLIFFFPIFYIFTILPLNLHSFHLGGPTVFFLVWLGNFKLFLFSFDLGPLSSSPPKPLLHFIFIGALPIKFKQILPPISKIESNPSQISNFELTPSKKLKLDSNPSEISKFGSNPSEKSNFDSNPSQEIKFYSNPSQEINKKLHGFIVFALKCLIMGCIVYTYEYKQYLHPYMVLVLYCCHMYLALEIILAVGAAPVRSILGLEIEPQSNEPYLSTSLQDFWGRRWNLMVTSILRPIAYDPVRSISARVLKPRWVPLPAIFSTFLVSGLMHELTYFYLTRVSPTWEVTWFFVLHGVCTAFEVVLKKLFAGRFQLHRVVSGALTVAFLAVTAAWLFFPQLLRNGVDDKAIGEYKVFKDFLIYNLKPIFSKSVSINL